MKNILAVSIGLLLVSQIFFASAQEGGDFTAEEISALIRGAEEIADNITQKEEAVKAIRGAIELLFQKNGYYRDEEMIEAIVAELTEKYGKEQAQSSFEAVLRGIPREGRLFRTNIFNQLLDKYGVREFEKDQGVMVDVYKDPELFGFTYKAYLAMTFNPDEEVRKAKQLRDDIASKTETKEAETTGEGHRAEL